MEELKLLVEMVADLPNTAIWVLVLFFAYKVSIIGSIYGCIRLAINQLHGWLTTPKHTLIKTDYEVRLKSIVIHNCEQELHQQLERLRGVTTSKGSEYIHYRDVLWLRDAIDKKLEADAQSKSKPREAA